jgi:hypothetical protein
MCELIENERQRRKERNGSKEGIERREYKKKEG